MDSHGVIKFTEEDQRKAENYIKELGAKQEEILDAGLDTAEEMNEVISKRMAIDTFKACAENGAGIDGIVDALESLPPVEPTRIRGKWIRNGSWSEGVGMGESYGHYWKCDQCGYTERGGWDNCGRNYCSNCGSDNREVTE